MMKYMYKVKNKYINVFKVNNKDGKDGKMTSMI